MIEFGTWPGWFKAGEKDLKEWLNAVAKLYNSRILSLSYQFLDNGEILKANTDFLDHHYATDIISFGYEEGRRVSGEILIGHEVVAENADDLGVAAGEEMCRVIVHGLLHLIGFDDLTPEQKQRMRQEEHKCLILRPKNLRDS